MNYACRIEICSMKLKIRIERENATRAKRARGGEERWMRGKRQEMRYILFLQDGAGGDNRTT